MSDMTLPQPVAIASHRIQPQTRPGYVHLKVALSVFVIYGRWGLLQ